MWRTSPGRNTWQRPTHYQLLLEPSKWWVHVLIAKHLQPLWATRGVEDICLSLSLQKPPHSFQLNMKLEVVDKRNPALIRVATVVHTDDHRLRVRNYILHTTQCEFPCWSGGVSWLTLFYILKPHTWNKSLKNLIFWNRTVTTWLLLFQNNDFAGQCRACVREIKLLD